MSTIRLIAIWFAIWFTNPVAHNAYAGYEELESNFRESGLKTFVCQNRDDSPP